MARSRVLPRPQGVQARDLLLAARGISNSDRALLKTESDAVRRWRTSSLQGGADAICHLLADHRLCFALNSASPQAICCRRAYGRLRVRSES
jgi:hypothetical protein